MEESGCKKKIGTPKRVSKGYDWNPADIDPSNLDPDVAGLILSPKSPYKVSRPPNAFMLYARENRKLLAERYPQHKNIIISKVLGKMWQNMTTEAKAKYFLQAEKMKELHRLEHPGYVYNPKVARLQKSEKMNSRNLKSGRTHAEKKEKERNKSILVVKDIEGVGDETSYQVSDPQPPALEYIPNNPSYLSNPQAEASHLHESSEDQVPSYLSNPQAGPAHRHEYPEDLVPSYLSNPQAGPSHRHEYPEDLVPSYLSNPQAGPAHRLESSGDLVTSYFPNPPNGQYCRDLSSEEHPAPEKNSPAFTSLPNTSPDKFGILQSFRDSYHHKRQQEPRCTCGEQHSYETPPMLKPSWGPPYSMDYLYETGAMFSSFNRGRSSIPHSDHPVYLNPMLSSYQEYPTNPLCETTPRLQYHPFNDHEHSFCNLPTNFKKFKNSHENQARSYYRHVGNIHSPQPKQFTGNNLAKQQYNQTLEITELSQSEQTYDHSVRFGRMDSSDDMAKIRVQQWVNDSSQRYHQELEPDDSSNKCHPTKTSNFLKDNYPAKQQYNQNLEATALPLSSQAYNYELNPEKNDSIHLEENDFPGNDVPANEVPAIYLPENDVTENNMPTKDVKENIVLANNLTNISYAKEPHSQNLESSDPSANVVCTVSYEPEIGSQDFVCQNIHHSDDEEINVDDV